MTTLTENINQIVGLTQDETASIEKAYGTMEIPRGEFWVRQGSKCEQIGFVESGRLRIFYVDDTGNEVTCYFVTAGNFVSSFTSFLTNTPTHENISALGKANRDAAIPVGA